jgi:hypothetical protein
MKIIVNIVDTNKSVRFINNKLLKKTKQLKLCDTLNKRSIFELIKNPDETISIKTYKNKFLSAQPNGLLHCDRNKIDIWEKFTLITQEGEETNHDVIFLKTHHNTYVGYDGDRLVCQNIIPREENKLNIRYVDDNDIDNIKKEYTKKIGNDVANGFKITGIAIGSLLIGIVKIASAMLEDDKEEEVTTITTITTSKRKTMICHVCGKKLHDPFSAAHLGSLRHRNALSGIHYQSNIKTQIIIKNKRNYIEEELPENIIIHNY